MAGSKKEREKKAVTFFEKKVTKKTLSPTAFEWSKFGRSKTVVSKSFLRGRPARAFFSKKRPLT
jgi:hypothetical protein